jgi:phage terminase large subunit
MQAIEAEFSDAFEELFVPHRIKVFYGGRGGAKSWAFARALLLQGYQKPIRVLCAREIQNSIRESVHKLLAEQVDNLGLGPFYAITDRSIRGKNGTEFIFEGLSRNVDKIKSMEGIDRCWVEEAQVVSEESWQLLMPTIRKAGSEVWVSFNPRLKTDPTYKRFVVTPPEYAYVRQVSWRDNPWFTDEMRQEMEHDRQVDEDLYRHVWEGELREFAEGAVYGNELKRARREGRICGVPIERGVPINTFWDLGRNDTTAIVFHQRVGLENRFVYSYEHNFVGLDHYINYLHDWKDKHEIHYGDHYLPHDVDVTELSTNRSRREILEAGGVKPLIVVPRTPSVNEGIEQTRRAFHACYFDEDKCSGLIDALSNYQYRYDENNQTFRQAPLHNWASNYADAFRQFGQGFSASAGWLEAKPMSDRRGRIVKNRFQQEAAWRV